MKIIMPKVIIEDEIDGEAMLRKIERAGRTCYKSEDRITEQSAEKFVASILSRGHESVVEHEKITVRIICDRGVSHEIVRHRIASYSQESTRYCNYAGDKFGNELTYIMPCFFEDKTSVGYKLWEAQMQQIEDTYFKMIEANITPEQARSILPNSLKTEIVCTMNIRQWRHFLRLRTSPASHPQMREIAFMALAEFQKVVPALFEGLGTGD